MTSVDVPRYGMELIILHINTPNKQLLCFLKSTVCCVLGWTAGQLKAFNHRSEHENELQHAKINSPYC